MPRRTALALAALILSAANAGAMPAVPLAGVAPGLPLVQASADATPVRLPSREMQALRAAIAAYDGGDLGAGDSIASGLKDPAARAAAEWVAIRTASRQVGFARIAAFLETWPTWPAAETVRRRAEEALWLEKVGPDRVRAFFSQRPPLTDEGKAALARAALASGDRKGATALIRQTYRDDPLSGALEADVLAEFGGLLARADHKARADRLLYQEEHEAGLRAAARAGADVLALARARVAVDKKAANAAKLLAAVPSDLRRDPAFIFASTKALRRAEKPAEAAAMLAKAPKDGASLVDPDAWWTERRLIARQLLDAGQAKAAYKVAASHSADGDLAAMEAEFHAGWIALRFLDDPKTASRHFALVSQRAERPISVARGAYWQGRAAEAMGANAAAFYKAAARHPTTYYGQLAAARLGVGDIGLRSPGKPGAGDRAAFAIAIGTRAAALLYAAEGETFAAILASELAKQLPDPRQLALLAELARANGDMRAALAVGKAGMQRGLPLDAVAFPTSVIPPFNSVAGVEKAVVYGIARQESEFNTRAVSSAGARGLMQIMPATAKATAKSIGLRYSAEKLTRDPAYNATLGAAHLGDLIERYRGSYILTFAAYNAGGSRVADWVETYGDPRDPGVDPIDWVERIPFTETRNYVQRVMENVQVYRARLGTEQALLIESDLRRGRVE